MRLASAWLAAAALLVLDERKAVDVVCPIDGLKFKAVEITSTNDWGGIDADWCRHALKTRPLESYAWTCPGCHYSGVRAKGRNDFAASNAALKEKVLGKLVPSEPIAKGAAQEAIPGHVKYDLMAQVQILKGSPPAEAGRAWLSASWSARQGGAPEPEDYDEWEELKERFGLNRTPLDLGKRNRSEVELDAARRMEKEIAGRKPKGAALLLLRFGAAWLHRRHGENVEALSLITELQSSKGENSVIDDAVATMAASIELERRFQRKAAAQYRLAAEAASDARVKGETCYLLGELHRRLGEREEAMKWYEKALEGAATKEFRELVEKQRKK